MPAPHPQAPDQQSYSQSILRFFGVWGIRSGSATADTPKIIFSPSSEAWKGPGEGLLRRAVTKRSTLRMALHRSGKILCQAQKYGMMMINLPNNIL
jgi:hypothetical protein